MKNEVKNTKRFWRRGNVLDIAIVLLIIAALVAIGYRYYLADATSNEETMEEYDVNFSVAGALPSVAQSLRVNDEVYFADGSRMGELERHASASVMNVVVTTPAKVVIEDHEGNFISVDVPDGSRVDMQGTVSCHATLDKNGTIRINGETVVTPGQRLTVHTELATMVITVTSITAK